ncbi:MAG: F0F1 ATP synthase subunit epsilon [Rhodospirillales bacterium]|nr:F0F1 ATP synthase subunit epsilon [Rhodospirillales bacterium]
MAETLKFELVSPEKLLVSEHAEMVIVPGSEGDFGAMPRHAPMISTVRPGIIDVYNDGKVKERIFVAGGFAEVNEAGCTVLAEEAVLLADLTSEMVEKRQRAAQEALEEADTAIARARAETALAVAEAMRQAAGMQPTKQH